MSEDLEALRHLRIACDALLDLAGYSAYHDRASAALRTLDAADAGSDCVILYRDSIIARCGAIEDVSLWPIRFRPIAR